MRTTVLKEVESVMRSTAMQFLVILVLTYFCNYDISAGHSDIKQSLLNPTHSGHEAVLRKNSKCNKFTIKYNVSDHFCPLR